MRGGARGHGGRSRAVGLPLRRSDGLRGSDGVVGSRHRRHHAWGRVHEGWCRHGGWCERAGWQRGGCWEEGSRRGRHGTSPDDLCVGRGLVGRWHVARGCRCRVGWLRRLQGARWGGRGGGCLGGCCASRCGVEAVLEPPGSFGSIGKASCGGTHQRLGTCCLGEGGHEGQHVVVDGGGRDLACGRGKAGQRASCMGCRVRRRAWLHAI